jgi:CDP-diacylglycerol--serine O-phosphatidyltransferase
MICFGVLPALINYKISVIEILELQGITWQRILAFTSSIIYVLAALIRLAYFNVMEEERTKTTSEVRKYYEGLPVTTISIIFPTVYLLKQLIIGDEPCGILFNVLLVIVAALFVSRIPVKKLHTKGLVVVAVIGAAILLAIALTYRWPLF